MSAKAQFFSTDFFLSFVIFLLLFAGFYFAWNYSNNLISDSYNTRSMETRGVQASDVLIRTKGIPENWNSSNVVSIGIANSENVINKTLTLRLSTINYNISKALLGIQDFEYYLVIEDFNSSMIFTYGLNAPSSSKIILPITRYTLYDNESSKIPARMRLIIWE